jgi:hypothetical protein
MSRIGAPRYTMMMKSFGQAEEGSASWKRKIVYPEMGSV